MYYSIIDSKSTWTSRQAWSIQSLLGQLGKKMTLKDNKVHPSVHVIQVQENTNEEVQQVEESNTPALTPEG